MSDEPVYVVTEKANRALDALRDDLIRRIKFHVLTADEARSLYWAATRSVLADGAYHETHDGRMIEVKCGKCGKVERIPGNVLRWRCRCNPHIDRFSFQDRLT